MKHRRSSWLFLTTLVLGLTACKPQATKPLESQVKEATGKPSEAMMSQKMRAFRDQFNMMTTADDVARLFSATAEELRRGELKDPDIRLLAAQIYPLLKLRGLYWRLTPTVENNASNTFHSLVVTTLMQIATGARVFNADGGIATPGPWRAVNHFFLYPYEGVPNQFKKIAELQDFLVSEIVPDLSFAIAEVQKMRIAPDAPLVWDNQIIFGRNTFGGDADLADRFVTLYDAERELILSGLYLVRHNTLFSSAWDYDEFPEFVHALGKLVGFDGFLLDTVDGMSAKDRAQILCPTRTRATPQCTGRFAKLFTLRAGGQALMEKAYPDLVAAIDHLDASWQEVRKRENQSLGNFQLLDPQKLVPWTRINDLTISNMKALVRGAPVRSPVSDRVVTVNYGTFYAEPPRDLKSFIPIEFSKEGKRIAVAGHPSVRNYEYGASTAWDAAAYAPYFPDVKDGTEVPRVLKDLAQTWGGWMAGVPLTTMSMVF